MAFGILKRLAVWRKKKKTEPISVLIKGRSLDDVGLARNCTNAIVDCNPPAYQACSAQCSNDCGVLGCPNLGCSAQVPCPSDIGCSGLA